MNKGLRWIPGIVILLALAHGELPKPAASAEPASDLVMAVTVDDLPVGPPNRHTTEQQERITARLLAALTAHRVPAVGFVNEAKLEVDGAVDPRRVALLERWLDAGMDYLRYMQDMVAFYEEQSESIVKRRIPQVLLIHAYALNADRLGELLERLERRGYRWVSLAEALEDPAYRLSAGGYVGDAGITWLHRWAITARMDPKIFRSEPEVPGWVEALHQAAGR